MHKYLYRMSELKESIRNSKEGSGVLAVLSSAGIRGDVTFQERIIEGELFLEIQTSTYTKEQITAAIKA
ncbi:MAG: hypothetical protein AAGF87_12170 [Bacteroidota bacterium]